MGIALLECPRQRQAAHELLKDHRKSNQTKPAPIHRINTEINELPGSFVTQPPDVIQRASGSMADCLEQTLVGGEIFLIVGAGLCSKSGYGPYPFTHQTGPYFGHCFRHAPSNLVAHVHE